MFQSLGTDYQAFGTVAESEENWTQRAKTEWETSWQSKIFLNETAISFGFSQSALREKKIQYRKFLFGREGRIKFQVQNPSSISKAICSLQFVFGLSHVKEYSTEGSDLLLEN